MYNHQLNTGTIFTSTLSWINLLEERMPILRTTYLTTNGHTREVNDFIFKSKDIVCSWRTN